MCAHATHWQLSPFIITEYRCLPPLAVFLGLRAACRPPALSTALLKYHPPNLSSCINSHTPNTKPLNLMPTALLQFLQTQPEFAGRQLPVYVTPTGWKFFGNLLDERHAFGGSGEKKRRIALCGEESFGTFLAHTSCLFVASSFPQELARSTCERKTACGPCLLGCKSSRTFRGKSRGLRFRQLKAS